MSHSRNSCGMPVSPATCCYVATLLLGFSSKVGWASLKEVSLAKIMLWFVKALDAHVPMMLIVCFYSSLSSQSFVVCSECLRILLTMSPR